MALISAFCFRASVSTGCVKLVSSEMAFNSASNEANFDIGLHRIVPGLTLDDVVEIDFMLELEKEMKNTNDVQNLNDDLDEILAAIPMPENDQNSPNLPCLLNDNMSTQPYEDMASLPSQSSNGIPGENPLPNYVLDDDDYDDGDDDENDDGDDGDEYVPSSEDENDVTGPAVPKRGRFDDVDGADVPRFIDEQKNPATKRKTKYSINLFQTFLQTKQENRQIYEISPKELDEYLSVFFPVSAQRKSF